MFKNISKHKQKYNICVQDEAYCDRQPWDSFQTLVNIMIIKNITKKTNICVQAWSDRQPWDSGGVAIKALARLHHHTQPQN